MFKESSLLGPMNIAKIVPREANSVCNAAKCHSLRSESVPEAHF